MAGTSDSSPSNATEDVDRADGPDTERAPNTLLNALVGGIVAVVSSFLPFSPALGGAVAGYLEGGDYSAGAKVGAIAGGVAFVPFVFFVGIALVFVPAGVFPPLGVWFSLAVSLSLIVLAAAVYTVGLGVLGGIAGVYLKEKV